MGERGSSGSGGGKGGSGGASNGYFMPRLGDEVTFRGVTHVIISSEGDKPDSMLTLRPLRHLDDSSGFYDVHIARYELRR